ncbi:type II toxin-antitoxin system RelE/ParE family toxin [Pannus brasiliensis CCIBt3594]|uniref:Type II toxin-antitoxin system RelE/ParE family toxin n=1 Tax=Pannus brasiliensis CCIBt3594 TaxID=1427578 RepID=A0AAW9QZ91_9CHRO
MNVEFRRTFKADLRALKDRNIKQRIQKIIEEVESAQNLTELRNVKAIQGYPGFYRIRVGDYRIGFYVERDVIAFVRLLHRKEMYRYFP